MRYRRPTGHGYKRDAAPSNRAHPKYSPACTQQSKINTDDDGDGTGGKRVRIAYIGLSLQQCHQRVDVAFGGASVWRTRRQDHLIGLGSELISFGLLPDARK